MAGLSEAAKVLYSKFRIRGAAPTPTPANLWNHGFSASLPLKGKYPLTTSRTNGSLCIS